MAKVVLRLEITRGTALCLLAAAFVAASPAELGSETLTLTTTYPAPFGVYTQLITTGKNGANSLDTTLNRDGGNTVLAPYGGKVGIATAAPGATLTVAGQVQIRDGTQGAGLILTSDDQGRASWGYATFAP